MSNESNEQLRLINLVAPLTHLTRKDVKYIWTEQCQKSFEGVKYALTHAPVLSLPIFGERFEVICDASLLGIGAVLLFIGRPIAFESRKLTPAEKNYTTGEQELTAVVHALRTWAMLFRRFRICSDYRSQSINLSKVTTEFVKASGSMVRVFGANFSLLMGVSSWEKQCCRSIKQEPIR